MKRIRAVCLWVVMAFPCMMYGREKYATTAHPQPDHTWEASAYGGMIIKHTYRFLPTVNQPSRLFELTYCKTTQGNHIFERVFRYPQIGGSLIVANFGNNDVFGNGIGVLPHFTFWIKRRRTMDMYFRVGIGLAWLTKPYNFTTNPTNNVIGSHLNNMTQLKWGFQWKVSENANINTALSVTHFSNGHSQNPNLGINFLGASVGYVMKLGMDKVKWNTDSIPPLLKKNYYVAGLAMGVLEAARVPDGPTFNTYSAYFLYQRTTGHTNRLMTEINVEFSDLVYKETMYRENNESSIQNTSVNALNIGLVVGDELMFQRLGLMMQLGVYVFRPYRQDQFMFQKLGLNYYFPMNKKDSWSLFTGINVKLHLSVAESLEFRSGIRF